MTNQQNILQYEYLHPEGSSLHDLLKESLEGTSDRTQLSVHGHKSSTVIRIYDTKSKVTKWAQRIKTLRAQREKLLLAPRGSPFRMFVVQWKMRIIRRKLKILRGKLSSYAVNYLVRSLRQSLSVAVNKVDHSFREAEEEEPLELAQAARVAKDFWLFVFEPNKLLAAKNKMVVSVLWL